MLMAFGFRRQPHVYVLSRHTFQSDSTLLVHNYYINYADNVTYMTFVDKLYTCVR